MQQSYSFAMLLIIMNILAAYTLYNTRRILFRFSNGEDRKITNWLLNFFDSKWPFYSFSILLTVVNLFLYPVNIISINSTIANIKNAGAGLVSIDLILLSLVFWAVSVIFFTDGVKTFNTISLVLTLAEGITAMIMNFISIDKSSGIAAVILAYLTIGFLLLLFFIFIESLLVSPAISNLRKRLNGYTLTIKQKNKNTKEVTEKKKPLPLSMFISKKSLKYVFDKDFND